MFISLGVVVSSVMWFTQQLVSCISSLSCMHVDYYCTEIFSPAADVVAPSFDIIGETYKSGSSLITERHLM